MRKKNKKYEEPNFEGVYLHDSWADSTEIWNGMCPTPPQQKMVQFHSGIIELQMREYSVFLVPV